MTLVRTDKSAAARHGSLFAVVVGAFLLAEPRALQAAACGQYPALCNLTVNSTVTEPNLESAVDIVILGDGFTDMGAWHSTANNFVNAIKADTSHMYAAAFKDMYNFHVVDVVSATNEVNDADTADTALGASLGQYSTIQTDGARVAAAAANAPDVDLTITIINGSGRANAYYPGQLMAGSSVRITTSTGAILHELGHALFHLADEYNDSAICSDHGPTTESTFTGTPNITKESTCAKWAGLTSTCTEGGHYCPTGNYRPSTGSTCRMWSGSTPCPVCAHEIATIARERRTGVDLATPWIVLNTPTSPVSGGMTLSAGVYDHVFPQRRVVFEVDGQVVRVVEAPTTFASHALDTRALIDGAHTATATVTDMAGHTRTSFPINFTTANHGVVTAPAVTVSNPTEGAVLQGSYATANANVTGGVRVARLELWVDGVFWGGAADAAYASVDVAALPAGAHTVQAKLVDYAGNTNASTVVNFTRDPTEASHCGAGGEPGGGTRPGGLGGNGDGEGQCGPQVAIESPAAWATVGPRFLFLGRFWSAGATVSAQLLVDGAVAHDFGSLVTNGGSLELARAVDASSWTAGIHSLVLHVVSGADVVDSDPTYVMRGALAASQVFIVPPVVSRVRGTVSISVDGVAVGGLSRVVLIHGEREVAQAATLPAALSFVTTAAPDSCATLVARLEPSTGPDAWSQTFFVCTDNTAPSVSWVSPEAGAKVPPAVVVASVDAQDPGGQVTKASLFVDGAKVGGASYPGSRVGLLGHVAPGAHTLAVEVEDAVGWTARTPDRSVVVQACAGAGDCDDGLSCTTDTCAPSGGCFHAPTAACCTSAAQCDDGNPCTTDACPAGSCTHNAVPSCCLDGRACQDADACTQDLCLTPGGTCSTAPQGCCATATDCIDGDSCTTDLCVAASAANPAVCAHVPVKDCCHVDQDCDDDNDCTTDTCAAGTCQHAAQADCCDSNADCDDGNLCTSEVCLGHTCMPTRLYNCCTADADCATANVCMTATCDTTLRQCLAATPVAGCCNFDSECDDANACTADACDANACKHIVTCCNVDADCNDTDLCTTDTCGVTLQCDFAPIAGCCTSATDCDDGDACTSDTCDAANQCVHGPVADCCTSDGQCDDGDVCTTDTCAANACAHVAVDNCPPVESDGGDDGGADGGEDGDTASSGDVDDVAPGDGEIEGSGIVPAVDGTTLAATGCACSSAQTNDDVAALWLAGFGALWLRRRKGVG